MRLSSSNYRLLPVYNVLQDQHRFMCGDPCDNVLTVIDTPYPPFQLVSKVELGVPEQVWVKAVCPLDTLFDFNWTPSAIEVQKDVDNDGVDEWIYTFNPSGYMPPFSIGIPPGTYYVEIRFPGDVYYYTETFTQKGNCNDCGDYWWLEYSHSCDEKSLGDYSMGFLNRLNLGDAVMLRDGELENIISRKDGYGVETVIANDVRPKWSFEIMGNSWLLDSLKFLKTFDQIYLKRSVNTDYYTLSNIDVTSRGDITNDCQFPIKITFTKDVLVNTKCCDSVYEQAPVPGNCTGMSVMTSADFSLCEGDSVELMATVIGGAAPYVYIWSNGETGQTIEVTPTETITLIVTVVDAFGCVKQDEVTITVVTCDELVLAIVADPTTPICEGASVDLDLSVSGGSGSYTYLWSTGATTQDITVTPAATTTYSVTVTDTVSGDISVATKTITVYQAPGVTIIKNGCDLSIAMIEDCSEGSPEHLWQVETAPDDWDPAPGINDGTTYTGISGNNYRLLFTCYGCTGISNELTVTCNESCDTEIVSCTYDSVEEELTIEYATVLGSNPFISGFCVVFEAEVPNLEDCPSSVYGFLINITLTSESGTLVIPYIPSHFPTCVLVSLSINAGECHDAAHFALT